ncbi:MAG: hypothetical protein KKB62_03410 [Nanoarchaeota archaeon]|nr:hypothetical protein [Nanoarchaeota archaeon]
MVFTWEKYYPKGTVRERMEFTLFARIAGTYGDSTYQIITEDEEELSKTLVEKGLVNVVNGSATITPKGIGWANSLLSTYLKK